MSNVFRLHVTDQTNRVPVIIDIRDDPQSHERGPANARRRCNRRTCVQGVQSMTYRSVPC
jgi:hypothetical protein